MTDSSNTGKIRKSGTFTKGDPRINRKGRPRSFDALRELAQEIAHEIVRLQDGQPALVNGKPVTTVELVLRSWAQSKDPRKQAAFIEYAYGKVPQATEVTGKDGGPVELQHGMTAELRSAISQVYGGKADDGDTDD